MTKTILWEITCYMAGGLIIAAIIFFPPLLLILMLFIEGPMPWNREKESNCSGNIGE